MAQASQEGLAMIRSSPFLAAIRRDVAFAGWRFGSRNGQAWADGAAFCAEQHYFALRKVRARTLISLEKIFYLI
jgi:hypothetical protein